MRWLRENSLSLVFLALLAVALIGQSISGQHDYNAEQVAHHEQTVSYLRYLTSSSFWAAVTENWQSEFLQFSLFIAATIWLIQRGSNESKPPEDAGLESDQKQQIGGYAGEGAPQWARTRGWRTALYSHSLLLLMMTIFFLSWFAQSLTDWNIYNEDQRQHQEATVSWTSYLTIADFWEKTFENWQSEFLAVGTMAVFTIYLRQRGSPESKPVGAPHGQTGTSG